MHAMLLNEGRQAALAPSMRRLNHESDESYAARLFEAFERSNAQVAWLCTPPGDHVPFLMRAALDANLNVIVEKPWTYSAQTTAEIDAIAARKNLKIGIDFEYCLVSEVEHWRTKFSDRRDLEFSGVLNVHAKDHLNLSPLLNLGSHLVAVQTYAAPQSKLSSIQCAYEAPDQRAVRLHSGDRQIAEIDFWQSKEPIIQRFVHRFEASFNESARFPFDLQFAMEVGNRLGTLKEKSANR